MEFYDFVFVVLVYRNPRDLAGFLASLAKVEGRCKVVVVNSFYDEDTMHEVEELCKVENCAFLNVKNRGYGAGNNAGIAYAREKYKFRYLVISNPDIEILSLPASIFAQANDPILIGPLVQTESGKRQNPYMPAFSAFRERLMCRFAGHPREWPFFYLAVALNKAHRIFFNIFCGEKSRPVYALHGSFLLFSVKALERLEG
ncbi:MAG TPA: hypothetical protein DEP42_06685, partial [Ruminococcaceae bacterium]|nr:hypothetical protein [Oscillospiraceae bacterium]